MNGVTAYETLMRGCQIVSRAGSKIRGLGHDSSLRGITVCGQRARRRCDEQFATGMGVIRIPETGDRIPVPETGRTNSAQWSMSRPREYRRS